MISFTNKYQRNFNILLSRIFWHQQRACTHFTNKLSKIIFSYQAVNDWKGSKINSSKEPLFFVLSFLLSKYPIHSISRNRKTKRQKRTKCKQSKIFTYAFYKQVQIWKRFTWYSSNGLTHLGLQVSSRYFFGSTGSSSALDLI